MSEYYSRIKSPLGELLILGTADGLSRIHFLDHNSVDYRQWLKNSELCDDFFQTARRQLLEYLHGKRRHFTLRLNPAGTDFQKKVWRVLQTIPYGEFWSYQDVAQAVGNKNACRAVGLANGKNPLPLVIPCHRVIGKNGQLTGFSSGLAVKRWLLELEKRGA